MSTNIIDKLISFFEKENVCIYGINTTDKLMNAPDGFKPDNYMKNPKSFICFALPVPKSVYRLQEYRNEFIWRSQNLLYKKLDTLSIGIAGILESAGHAALPVSGCLPLRYNHKKEIAGYQNQMMMGSIAGIGFIGKNGLLINNKYGSRLMLGTVLTNAPLRELCTPEKHRGDCPPECSVCSDKCPIQAIDRKTRKVNIMKCLYYTSKVHALPKLRFFLARVFNPQASLNMLNRRTFDDNTFHTCSLCVSECPFGD